MLCMKRAMKKRTQKLLAMFLAVAMAISMTACGGSGAPASSGGGEGNTAIRRRLLSIHEYGFPAVEDILAVSSGNPGRRKAEAGDSALLADKGGLPSVYQRL